MFEWEDHTTTPPTRVREERSDSGELDCPACGRVNSDLWEFGDGTQEFECHHCEAKLRLTIETARTYTLRHEEVIE